MFKKACFFKHAFSNRKKIVATLRRAPLLRSHSAAPSAALAEHLHGPYHKVAIVLEVAV